jgi:hypothetical protein
LIFGPQSRRSEVTLRGKSWGRYRAAVFTPHRTTQVFGQKKESIGAEGVPGGGQVVNSLQSEPECLRTRLSRSSDDIAA